MKHREGFLTISIKNTGEHYTVNFKCAAFGNSRSFDTVSEVNAFIASVCTKNSNTRIEVIWEE
jgi:hypothetical protein